MNDTEFVIIKFDFYTLYNNNKLNQTLKLDTTDKIEGNNITIIKVEYMTH